MRFFFFFASQHNSKVCEYIILGFSSMAKQRSIEIVTLEEPTYIVFFLGSFCKITKRLTSLGLLNVWKSKGRTTLRHPWIDPRGQNRLFDYLNCLWLSSHEKLIINSCGSYLLIIVRGVLIKKNYVV
jgi:hypothetical protein